MKQFIPARLIPPSATVKRYGPVGFIVVVGVIGSVAIANVLGAGLGAGIEAESGRLTASATVVADSQAAGGQAVKFGAATQTQTFTPTAIALSADEIANPNRGLYDWNGDTGAPQADAPKDVYRRVAWSKIEPTQGNYDFSIFNRDLAQAKAQGGKFSFRVMAMAPQAPLDNQGDHDAVPQYLRNAIDASPVKGWVHTNSGTPFDTTYIPDWNNAFFLGRVDALYAALGQAYAGDPAVDRLDIGIYGLTGEWHMGIEGDDYNQASDYPRPAPSGAQMITTATMKRIIDAHVSHFPTKQFVMLWGHSSVAAGVNYAMNYPGIAKPIGLRNDCMGWVGHAFTSMAQSTQWTSSPTMANRWKTAPFVVEPCNFDRRADATWVEALQEDQDYHVSAVGNGNQGTMAFTDFTAAEQAAWIKTGKVSGYRYELRQVTVPQTLQRGSAGSFTATWANVGNAPIYEDWTVKYRLVNKTTGATAWERTSALDLKAMLPNASSPLDQTDSLTVPTTVAAGTYELRVVVTDAHNYYPDPLKLAITGRKADGSYALGDVAVQ